MKTIPTVLAASALLLLVSCHAMPEVQQPSTPADRSFHIRYEAKVKDMPVGEPLRMWIPIPHDDPFQSISDDISITPSVEGYSVRITVEPIHGNRMIFIEGNTVAPELTVTVEYDVDRWENTTNLAAISPEGQSDGPAYAIYRQPSTLGAITEEIRTAAAKVDAATDTVTKARAFYDHVAQKMAYDKSGLGWGRGDTAYACDIGKGNCTDFHAYFIAMCQSQDIAARFQIGLYGSYDDKPGEEYETGGYHCWAEFHVPGQRWVPVDISEGDKNPDRLDYFFGNHTANRVTLSMGRDLILSPPQQGEPLNYFLYPYAEINGKAQPTQKTSYWRDTK